MLTCVQGVDWWTLGILIFETLVGQPPFNDEDPMGIYQQVRVSDDTRTAC